MITASQLAAMPTGTALIMVDNQYKFITHLPFYAEMFDNSHWKAPQFSHVASGKPFKPLDFAALVKEVKLNRLESEISNKSVDRFAPGMPVGSYFSDEKRTNDPTKIGGQNAKVAGSEAKEEAEQKKQDSEGNYHVIITEVQNNRMRIAYEICKVTGEDAHQAMTRLAQIPASITFSTEVEAVMFMKEIFNAGGKAIIQTS